MNHQAQYMNSVEVYSEQDQTGHLVSDTMNTNLQTRRTEVVNGSPAKGGGIQ